MAAWTLAVRDDKGRQICGASVEARRLADIEVQRDGRAVTILLAGDSVALGYVPDAQPEDEELTLYRWSLTSPDAEVQTSKV